MKQIIFKIGFWHPFGVAAGESRDCIISRKKREIKKNGWTLWSFQSRTDESRACETINKWRKEINKYNPKKKVFVLCSDSPNAKDPKGKVSEAKQFKFANSNKWQDLRHLPIKVPHSFGKRPLALAFKVKAVYKPDTIGMPKGIKWLCKDGKWRKDKLPSRREFLIKSGGKCRLRKVYQILELEPPYLAVLRK